MSVKVVGVGKGGGCQQRWWVSVKVVGVSKGGGRQ